jgi:hypothetical protein
MAYSKIDKALAATIGAVAIAVGGYAGLRQGVQDSQNGLIKNAPVYAAAFGALCDGENDDTGAIQAALDIARETLLTSKIHGRKVLLPGGECMVSDTLVMRDAWGLRLQGQGDFSTVLNWDVAGGAPNDRPMIRLADCRRCVVEDLEIFANSGVPEMELDTGIQIVNDAATSLVTSSNNIIQNITINGSNGAIRLGVSVFDDAGGLYSNTNNEHHIVKDSRIVNFGPTTRVDPEDPLENDSAAVYINGSNFKQIRVTRTQMNGAALGGACIWLNNGSYQALHNNCAAAAIADHRIDSGAETVMVIGQDGENSTRFMTIANTSAKIPVIIQSVRWSHNDLHADECAIVTGNAGPISISGSLWGSSAGAGAEANLGFCFHNFRGETAVSFVGNTMNTGLRNPFLDASGCSTKVCVDPAHHINNVINGANNNGTSYDTVYDLVAQDDDPVLYWQLDETSGTTANDETDNAQDGTYSGTYVLQQASISDAYDADEYSVTFNQAGDTGTVTLATVGTWPTTDFTMTWLSRGYRNHSASGEGILSYAGATDADEIQISCDGTANQIGLAIGGSALGVFVKAPPCDMPGPHHYAVTWRNSDGRAELFVDGQKVDEITVGSGDTIEAAGQFVVAQVQTTPGGGGFTAASALTSEIDGVAVYNTVLSANTVGIHYSAASWSW